MDKKLTTSEILIVAGGAAALLGTFLPWLSADFGGDLNAWDSGLFPTYTWVGIFGALLALAVVLPKFANVNLPDRILGFTLNQVLLELAFFSALLVLSFLILDKGSVDMAIGFFLSLLGAGAALAGAWMLQNEARPAAGGTGGGTGMGGGMGGPAAPPPPPGPPSTPPPPPPPV